MTRRVGPYRGATDVGRFTPEQLNILSVARMNPDHVPSVIKATTIYLEEVGKIMAKVAPIFTDLHRQLKPFIAEYEKLKQQPKEKP